MWGLHLFLKLTVLLAGAGVCHPRRETEKHHMSVGNGQKEPISLSTCAPRKSKGNIIKSSSRHSKEDAPSSPRRLLTASGRLRGQEVARDELVVMKQRPPCTRGNMISMIILLVRN